MIFENDIKMCSVSLAADKCKGCINCMKRCPTEAIRVRSGKARVIEERCVGCGECVRICPMRAKVAVSDPLSAIDGYKYKIALPCPTMYGQFPNLTDVNVMLSGLLDIGFDECFEVGVGCEIVSETTRQYLKKGGLPRPLISSACPAVVKLIQISYGHLVEHISPVMTPEEAAGRMAVERAMQKGYAREDIGVFVISPCSAKWEALRGVNCIDGVLSFSEVYFKLVAAMNKITQPHKLSAVGRTGLSWATSGGEADGSLCKEYLAADGVENVIKILEEIDHDKLAGLDFVELTACPGGCVGGVLNIENPFLAKSRSLRLKQYVPITDTHREMVDDLTQFVNTRPYSANNVFKLSDDRAEAFRMMQRIEQIHKALPGIDCGSCGAPSCRAMAEDLVISPKSAGHCQIQLQREKKA